MFSLRWRAGEDMGLVINGSVVHGIAREGQAFYDIIKQDNGIIEISGRKFQPQDKYYYGEKFIPNIEKQLPNLQISKINPEGITVLQFAPSSDVHVNVITVLDNKTIITESSSNFIVVGSWNTGDESGTIWVSNPGKNELALMVSESNYDDISPDSVTIY